MPNILWLSEIKESNQESVGNKAFAISQLYQSSFTVPPAFCITKEAFKHFLDNTGCSKDSITKAEMPLDLRREIEEAYENINVDPGIQGVNKSTFSLIRSGRDAASVVVRVSANNSPERSTMLNVKGSKNLINSIKEVWSVAYSAEDMPALIIQKMVSPSISGVIAFDNDDIILKSIYGFLESKNMEKADTYRLDRNSLIVKNREKKMQEYKIVKDDMINTIATKKVFNDDFKMGENELRIAGNVGRMLIDDYKTKEVEFAIEGNKLHLLGVKNKSKEIEEKKDSLPDLLSPIPDTLLSFEPLKRDIPKAKEETINGSEMIEVKLGNIHIRIPKDKKAVEAAYKLLDAISSHLDI